MVAELKRNVLKGLVVSEVKSKTGVRGFSKQSLTGITPLPLPEFDETCAELCNLHASSIEMSEFQAAISKLQSKTAENNQITAKSARNS